MDREQLQRRLMGTFLGELEEQVQAFNRDLLALEKDSGEGRHELLISLFRTAHSLKGAARSVNVEPIEAACHRLESLLGPARDGQRVLDAEAIELLYATADALKEAGERLRAQPEQATGRLYSLLPPLDAAARRPGTASASPSRDTVETTAAPEPPIAPLTRDGLVRMPAEKLDAVLTGSGELLVARRRLMEACDELVPLQDELHRLRAQWSRVDSPIRRIVTSQARLFPKRVRLVLEGTHDRLKDLERRCELVSSRIRTDQRALERAAATLGDDIRRMRLFPFSDACEGLERLVRDLTHASGKQAVLLIGGGEIELGRLVLQALKIPLLHLVRNAVDHGIESPEERVAAAKSPEGHITVKAALRTGTVDITIADDGRGFDLPAIRAVARHKNLPVPDDDREAARLVFLPGFSTAPLATEISGRGMGLDVVKHQVESFHGDVDIAFEPGQGTRIVLTVPLTIATTRALLLGVGGQVFALPSRHVQRLVRAGPADLGSIGGREVLLSEGAPTPLVLLAEALGIRSAVAPPQRSRRAPLVVVASGATQVAFAVDELLAEEEVVVKSLGLRLKRVRHFVGATILPSGRVALILNAADLVRSAVGRAPARSLTAALAERGKETRRQRLLLAEDSVTTRSLEKSILEAAGYGVVVAVDGSDAWRLLQERGADLVVADVEMPRMDGFALCEAIRRSPRFRDLPIVLVTARENDTDKARGLEVGADAYLLKSAFDQRNLLDTIARLL